MNDWKNITTYSRGETDRTPRTWKLTAGKITLIVTQKWWGKGYGATGWSGWHVECEPFLRYEPKGDDIEAIKAAALLELKNELTKHVAMIGGAQ